MGIASLYIKKGTDMQFQPFVSVSKRLISIYCLLACVTVIITNSAAAQETQPEYCMPDPNYPEHPDRSKVDGMSIIECKALMKIYEATDGPNWEKTFGGSNPWGEDGPICSGTAKCSDFIDGIRHVVELNLKSVGMDGVLPGAAFSELPYLVQLDLSHNALHGLIPYQIAELKDIKTLILNNNEFSGAIPENLLGDESDGEGLTSPSLSDRLYLGENNLSGQLPLSLGRDDVRHFSVYKNPNLSGPIPSTYIALGDMYAFKYWETQICEPQDAAMQVWLDNVLIHRGTGIPCDDPDPIDPPPVPGYINASQGTSLKIITVEWGTSVGADYYDLERARGTSPGLIWEERDTPSGTNLEDQELLDQGVPYHYRVRACYNNGTCSAYRTIPTDAFGYLAMPSLDWLSEVLIELEDGTSISGFSWNTVSGAEYYRAHYSKNNINSKVYEENSENFIAYANQIKETQLKVPEEELMDRVWAFQACSPYDICSQATMWWYTPSMAGILFLLLSGD